FSVKLLGTALGLGAIAAMALGLGYRGATLSLILSVALAKSFEAVSELVFGLLQRAEDMRRIAVSMLAKGTVSVLAVGVVLKLTGNLALHFVTDPRAFRRLTLHTTLIAGGLGLVAVAISALCGRALLTVAYAPEYAEYAPVLIWLAVATGIAFLATALSYAVTAARRLPEQLAIALLSLAVCTLASCLLVPRYGLLGAAWAVLATEATRLTCLAVVYGAA